MRILIALSITFVLLGGRTAIGDDTLDAVWKPQTVEFAYIGVTTKYNCLGLESQAANLVRNLGARDIKVTLSPCFDGTKIQSMHKIKIDYTALSEAPPESENRVKATGKEIVIDRRYLGRARDNHCELVERFAKYALPKTEFQVVSGDVSCNASRSALTGKLHVKTLTPAGDT